MVGLTQASATMSAMIIDKDELVRECWRFVRGHAQRLSRRSTLAYDDLFQVGMVAVLESVDKFDPDRGLTPSQYGVYCARFAMGNSISSSWSGPSADYAMTTRYLACMRDTDGDVTDARRLFAERYPKWPDRFDSVHAAKTTVARAALPETPHIDPDVSEPIGNVQLVDALLDVLTPEEREVIELHYLHGYTVPEVAEAIGLHPTNVNKRRNRALTKMRESAIVEEATA